jgi:exosortase K
VKVRENAVAFAVAAALAYALKAAFSRLGPDELRWITWPTQGLLAAVTDLRFTYEPGYGYVDLAHRLVIAKSCTGVNYLLAAFAMLVATVVPAVKGRVRKLAAVAAMLASAYAVTVAVNAARIAVGFALHDAGWESGWLDAARVHRLTGIAVYLLSLIVLHAAARHVLAGRGRAAAGPLVAAPLAAYAAITVLVPLANGAAAARPAAFAEHCAWIAVALAGFAAAARWRRPAAVPAPQRLAVARARMTASSGRSESASRHAASASAISRAAPAASPACAATSAAASREPP